MTQSGPRPRVHEHDLPITELVRLKASRDVAVTVCLPALNEAPTIGSICSSIGGLIQAGLVDELVVVDSGSADETIQVARDAGATVHPVALIGPPGDTEASGKGGALWKSLAVTHGDIIVWLDSDVRNFEQSYVTSLLAPLLVDPELRMTKAFYERPLQDDAGVLSTGGARVTELVFRPLAHLLFPELVGFVQPLSGEYAVYRADVLRLPFFTGYGVEAGLLIDYVTRFGLDAIAQVDLGSRIHRNKDVLALGRMSFEVMQVMVRRAEDLGRLKVEPSWPPTMTQFVAAADGPLETIHPIGVRELPPREGPS